MDTLILSCGTGGGHNSAGLAVKEALEQRGHHAEMLDPYDLKGKGVSRLVGNVYIKMAQKIPGLFGLVYRLGDLYRRLPVSSPVYLVNGKMVRLMENYLAQNHYDVVIMPHLFPGEILTNMKRKGYSVPKTIFVATDYTCIPFTEEIDCDRYVIPSEELKEEFCKRGIAREKLVPLGIPVSSVFSQPMERDATCRMLGLNPQKRYILLAGGSIGAGKMKRTIRLLRAYLLYRRDMALVIVCGNNERLYKKYAKHCEGNPRIRVLQKTDKMAQYMKICDLFISKPGGLSSTEAAVAETALLHVSPIPGCEKRNAAFFERQGMSRNSGNSIRRLLLELHRMKREEVVEAMRENQRRCINKNAAQDIVSLAENLIKEE